MIFLYFCFENVFAYLVRPWRLAASRYLSRRLGIETFASNGLNLMCSFLGLPNATTLFFKNS